MENLNVEEYRGSLKDGKRWNLPQMFKEHDKDDIKGP